MKIIPLYPLVFLVAMFILNAAHISYVAAVPSGQGNQTQAASPLSDTASPPAGDNTPPKQQETQTGNAVAAARTIGIVGENVIKARRGWVNIEPGSRPAYVGIQGGTAPITLLHSHKGSLLGYTGNTGNDFIQLLQGKEPPAVAQPPANSKEALELPLPPADIADFSLYRANSPFSSDPGLQPFGLSTPEHVVKQEEEVKTAPQKGKKAPPAKKKKKGRAKAKPPAS